MEEDVLLELVIDHINPSILKTASCLNPEGVDGCCVGTLYHPYNTPLEDAGWFARAFIHSFAGFEWKFIVEYHHDMQ